MDNLDHRILSLLASGLTQLDIAERVGVSRHVVRRRMTMLKRDADAATNIQLVAITVRAGLLEAQPAKNNPTTVEP